MDYWKTLSQVVDAQQSIAVRNVKAIEIVKKRYAELP